MKFKDVLKMDDKDIKANRIEIVNDKLKVAFTRCMEDIKAEIAKVTVEREDMLDMSSDFKDSINMDKFNAGEFVNDDLRKAMTIRNLGENLDFIKARYEELF